MKLIDIYIYEVTRRLPEKIREDIALELRSTIEDSLPDEPDEEAIQLALAKLGNPAILAREYSDQPMYLIGPRYFDTYVTLLKMIIPIAIIVSLITMTAEYLMGYNGGQTVQDIISAIIRTGIISIIDVGIQIFFWITIIFAIIERKDKGTNALPFSTKLNKWTPNDLKAITPIHKKKAITNLEVFGSFLRIAIWVALYFNAEHLIVYFRRGEGALDFLEPVFIQSQLVHYWPIITVLFGLEIALEIYKLIKKQWTKGLAVCTTALNLLGIIVFTVILMNPNLFNPHFINRMADDLRISPNHLESRIVIAGISLLVLIAALDILKGFRKARL